MNLLPTHRYRVPLLLLAIFALLAALWAGWLRIGWRFPALQPMLPTQHGSLMVSGFLGTLISIERAVALQKRWMYTSPALTGIGSLILISGANRQFGAGLLLAGSLVFVAILIVIVRRHWAMYTLALLAGGLAWFGGNLAWFLGVPVYRIVLFWSAFLVLTIVSERLELGRLIRLSRRSELLALLLMAIYLGGAVYALRDHLSATRVASIGMVGLAIWLFFNDIARRTVRKAGLPRFVALCLLAGYFWLGVGGIIGLSLGGQVAGLVYDAYLHTVYLGFVFSMIFGHAPIIFPAVLQLNIRFSPGFYIHLVLLHLSLILRLTGDLLPDAVLRLWGGLLNGIAILLFLGVTAFVSLRGRLETADNQPVSI